jgi:hypothetical protein
MTTIAVDITVSAAGLSAIAAIATVIVSLLNRKKIQEVHVLVNNQLDEVMGRLVVSQEQTRVLQKEKDDAS